MKRYKELEKLVIEWADDKGILEKGNTKAQAIKTVFKFYPIIQLQTNLAIATSCCYHSFFYVQSCFIMQ
jgi:hypothetical protein